MIRKETEWLIRIPGIALLIFALYKLYSRPLTHSYHDAFLFIYLQIVLWVMLLLVLILVITSFSSYRAKWIMGLLTLFLLAPYPFVHHELSIQAEQYFFQQRYEHLQRLNQQIIDASVDEARLYGLLAAVDIRGYEKTTNYVAYWVDRVPEQRDGFIFLIRGELPERLFHYPVNHTKVLRENWFSFTSK
ncbi:hypothetical protein [Catalinimonas niigatensis]|uniref:hypothetical protein n=1 Tax=Catalinimonas niigatensis TaxID=1397264 RepID=UPI002666864C|nr:hypothetical protein [Catalinimonas niigatensis]WPP48982.1 hypothetical protein PZB72_20145 [Catalinimonas niigatensis]